MTVVTPTDCPKSIRYYCIVEVFGDVFVLSIINFRIFRWYRGFCHRTDSDLLLFLLSNIKSSPAYGVLSQKLIRYARACSSYECLILRVVRLSNKLLGQGYVNERLRSSLRKIFSSTQESYQSIWGIPLPNVTRHFGWWPYTVAPSIDQALQQSWSCNWSWPYYRIWLFT